MENKEDRWRKFGAVVVRLTHGENISREEAGSAGGRCVKRAERPPAGSLYRRAESQAGDAEEVAGTSKPCTSMTP